MTLSLEDGVPVNPGKTFAVLPHPLTPFPLPFLAPLLAGLFLRQAAPRLPIDECDRSHGSYILCLCTNRFIRSSAFSMSGKATA